MLNIDINGIDGCSFLPAFDPRPALSVINYLWLITVIKILGVIVAIFPVYNQDTLVWLHLIAKVFAENVSGICVRLWGPRMVLGECFLEMCMHAASKQMKWCII